MYGDPAYAQNNQLVVPVKGAVLSADETEFNKRMNSVRVSVEGGFGKISRYWAFVDFHKNKKLLLQRVGKMYTVGGLLANVHTYCYGSQTSKFFSWHFQVWNSTCKANIHKCQNQTHLIFICSTSQPI
ncbi:hypothetical protein JG687_00016516 [Phytophthora cactorum]|uniref:DDE Tnp4 domain-containing protein n=1 Tax=Phytophthora cactorum TaxID=29920 RepID=A0A8T1TTL0_9STRA|nr:hypothetical protein JG687_00016516 [Phytophthora cactorum]